MKSNSGLMVRGCFLLTASVATQDKKRAGASAYEVEQLQWSFIPATGAPQLQPDQIDAGPHDLLCAGESGSWVANWHFMLDCGGRRAGP